MSRDTFAPAPAPEVVPAEVRGARTAGDRVRVVDVRDGSGYTIPSDGVSDALASGRVRIATPEEQAAQRQTEEYGDSPLLAGLAGAANRTSFGLIDGEAIQGLREENEDAFDIGGFGGDLALGALTGGATAGIRGAGLVGRLAAGAIEGAVVTTAEAGSRLSDERNLGDTEITAESLMASLGPSALLGGALGGVVELGFAGVGNLGRRVLARGRSGVAQTREALGRMVERTTGREAAPGVVDAVLERIGRTGTAGIDEAGAEFVQRGLARTAEGRALREAIDQGGALIDDQVRPLRSLLDDAAQIEDAAAEFAKGQLKRAQVRRMVRDDVAEVALDGQVASIQAVRGLVDDIARESNLPGGRALTRALEGITNDAEDRLTAALGAGGRDGAADAFIALDQMKRRFGQEVAKVTRSRNAGLLGPQFEAAYDVLRRHLEDVDLYGAAGEAQRSINEAWARRIATGRTFNRKFRTDAGLQDGFRQLRTADPQKIKAWLERTGTAASDVDDEIFDRFVRDQRDFLDRLTEHYELPTDTAAAVVASRTNTSAIRETLDRVRSTVGARNQFEEVAESLSRRDELLGGAVGPLALGVVGGLPGLALGSAVSALRRPDRVVKMLASMERMSTTFRGQLERRSGRLVERMARQTTGQGRRLPRGAVVGLTAAQIASRFDTSIETLTATEDPAAFAEQVAQRTQEIADAAPETASHLAAAAARASMYLRSQVPALAFDAPGMLGAPQTTPSQRVTEDEQRAFLSAAEAIEDPVGVLDQAEAGTLTAEHVDALRAVYPRLYQELVTTVTTEIADRDSPLPYAGRLSISLLLGVATDDSLTGAGIAAAQATYAGDAAEASGSGPVLTPGNRSAPDFAGLSATESQRRTMRRA